MSWIRLLVLGLGLVSLTAMAQEKRPITHADYEIWNSAAGFRLSPDGKFFVYTLTPPTGDAAIVIRNITTGQEARIPTAGKSSTPTPTPTAPTAPPSPSEPPVAPSLATSGLPTFSPDSKLLFFPIAPTAELVNKAKADKKKPEEMPKAVVAVYDLAAGKITERLEKVRNFSVVGEGSGYLLLQKEPKPDEAPKTESKEPKEAKEPKELKEKSKEPEKASATGAVTGAAPTATQPTTPPAPKRETTYELIVRNLADGKEVTYTQLTAHSTTKNGKNLLLTVNAKIPENSGIFLQPLNGGNSTTIFGGPARVTGLSWNDEQTQLAFYANEATPSPTKVRVMHWTGTGTAKELLSATPKGLKEGYSVLDRGNLSFSQDGLKLALNVGPTPPAAPTPDPKTEPKAETAPTPTTPGATTQAPTRTGFPGRGFRTGGTTSTTPVEEKVELDIWHWKDETIQPMQKVRGTTDRQKSYRAVYFFDTKELKQLSTDDLTADVPDFGDWTLASSDKAYKGQLWRSPMPRDVALLNIRTGEGKPLLKGHESSITSPYGNYALAFNGKDWISYSIPDGTAKNLTSKLKIPFYNEEFDIPTTPPPYGWRGWTADKKFVLISDRYDIWKFALDGSSAVNLTQVGRANKTTFAIVRTDDDANTLKMDLTKPMLLSATHDETEDTGFYRLEPNKPAKMLIMGPRRYGTPTKAKKADAFVMTVSTFAHYPDYYFSDGDFREVKRLTDIQPRKKEFNWGNAELVKYRSADGLPLQGILIKPENFDSSKQYPMIVYIYERLTDGLHTFRLPSAGTSINPTYYASNGYLVFMPDIAYNIGSPGQSAIKCVLPAIQAVVDQGCVNEKAIGIQGHSWGGYQIAYMVTQTNRFAAAAAGAPVTNMTSAYGGIRWGTGLPRQFQYEKTQSRIGANLWAAPMKYLENSPIFMADRVTTPLMMLHNDQDDAVPWYQGIEYYLALRRLDKEVYLLNYNGELHGLRKKLNQRDYTLRMQQFFDHHLKGVSAPEWMQKGVPFADRDKEKEQWKKLFGEVKETKPK
ncbi:MAG: prolyl oligopeptidase family serine peptidase [Fimbriiglobus sp.]